MKRMKTNIEEYTIHTELVGDDGIIEKLSIVCTGNLNRLINEFYDGTKKPKIYEDLIEAIKKAKLHMSDWGK